jgi:glycerophosphoryl diester phosphodiesterase
MKAKFINIGHRGAAAYARENTKRSFEEAIARQADMIEYDVRRTADGTLVLFHDRTIRTPWGRRPVSKLNFDDMLESARIFGVDVARFEDIVKSFGSRIPMNVEIKARGFEEAVVEVLRRHPPKYLPTISSFFPWVVGRIKELNGNLATGLIIGKEQAYKFSFLNKLVLKRIAQNIGLKSMHLQESIVNARVIKRLNELGLKIFVWTVDDEDRMRELIELGVDGIITNKPDILYRLCLEMSGGPRPLMRKIASDFGRFAYVESAGRLI